MLIGSILLSASGPTYTVLEKFDHYELRKYDAWVVAETTISGTFQDSGSEAFHILAGYIFGKNAGKVKIEMTAPVTQQEVAPGKYLFQFMMPAEWTLDTLPKPDDSRVILKKIPERTLFAVRYTGGWSERLYNKELNELRNEAELKNIKINTNSQPIWARYNSPMAPSVIRTNEVLYETL